MNLEQVVGVLGDVPKVAYEAPHVYPLSAPAFEPAEGRTRPPVAGPEPVKLYVHVPFCNYACTFCFYAKQIRAERGRMARYVDAATAELAAAVEPGTPIAQVYVGGGTPTALPADLLSRLLGALPEPAGESRTVEASPESVTADHVAVLRDHGVERVSMGVETLDAGVLDGIRRRHSGDDAAAAARLLVDTGFVVNVDLMYGFPGQAEASFAADLATVAGWGVPSISLYNLRLNEHTPLARAAGDLLDLGGLVAWRRRIAADMDALGYEQSRWHTWVRRGGVASSFGRAPCVDGSAPGRQVGIGVSSVSHVGDVVYRNVDTVGGYLDRVDAGGPLVDGVFDLAGTDRRTLLVARTLGDGQALPRSAWREAFGVEVEDDHGPLLDALGAAGLVALDDDAYALTADGRLLYDLVTLAFYPQATKVWLRARQP